MEERRSARIGTVSGLALLTGGTAITATAGGAHSVFATFLLCLLTLGMCHSLYVEIRRQARRRTPGGWSRHDTINAVLLAGWAVIAAIGTIQVSGPAQVWVVGLSLCLGYASSCGYFVMERRRTIASSPAAPAEAAPDADPAAPEADPAAADAGPTALPTGPPAPHPGPPAPHPGPPREASHRPTAGSH